MLDSLWKYRHFIKSSIKNELVTRFARSKLGGLWVIINPLMQVAIYALILSNVLAAKLPGIENKYAYAIYLIAGLLAWTLFSEMVGRFLNLFIENANLMKKVSFPRIALPAIVVGSNLINNMMLFVAMVMILILLGHNLSVNILWIIPLTLALTAFSVGLGLILGVFNVFIRDIGQGIPIILQIWFWFTPIVYPASIIPESYQQLLSLNPVYHFTHAYQEILVYGRAPELEGVIIVSSISVALLLFSFLLFRRASKEMVDVL